MKRSPAPTPSSPLITIRARSDSASSRSTRCCIRSVSTSRGFCTPGRSTRTSWRPASASVAMPRIARRVVCGRTETIATWLPTIALTSVDLPTLGRPGEPDEAGAGHRQRPSMHPRLQGQHLAVVGLVVVAAEVEDAVDGGLGHVAAVLGADRDVAELARAGDRAGAVDREGEHVGRLVLAAVLAVELADPLRVDDLDRQVAVLHPGRRERRLDRPAQLLRDVAEVEAQDLGVGPCSDRAARSRSPWAS